MGQYGGQRPGRTALAASIQSHKATTACLPSSSGLLCLLSPSQGCPEHYSLRISSFSLWNACEEMRCTCICAHMCVCACWGVISPTPTPGKNGEHSVSPKPQDPLQEKQSVEHLELGPGTHLTEDDGRLTTRWNVKAEVSPLHSPSVCFPNIDGASFLAGWCWTLGPTRRQGTG